MKKIISFFPLIFISFCLWAQRIEQVSFTCEQDDFLFKESNGCVQISSVVYPALYPRTTDNQGLPYIIIHVLIGSNEEYIDVDYDYSEESILKDFILGPPIQYAPRNRQSYVEISREEDFAEPIYSPKKVIYIGTHSVGGFKYLSFLIYPFKYYSEEHQLNMLKDFIIKIRLSQVKENITCDFSMKEMIKSIVINKEKLPLLYYPSCSQIGKSNNRTQTLDYLIITCDSLKDAYTKLANWKKRKGVKTEIVTIEHIDSFYSIPVLGLVHTPYSIKRAIKHYKDSCNIKYVLLGGDTNIVPTEHCHIQYNKPGALTVIYPMNGGTACDLYYACLNSPLDWDLYRNNHTYGEYEDLVDCHPMIAVSRLSTNSIMDAEEQVGRIIAYEMGAKRENWNNKNLMMGCAFDSNYIHNGFTDVYFKGRNISDSLSYYGAGESFHFYDSYTSHENQASYDVSPLNFKEQLSNGYKLVHIDTHGDIDCYAMENDDYFFNSDAMDYTNPSFSMISTSSCSTNDFEDDCLSEAFMRNTNGNIYAYWGGSNTILGQEDEQEWLFGSIDLINLEFYKNIFSNRLSLGDAVNATRLKFIPEGNGNIPYTNPYRWQLFCMNLLGDPETLIYKQQPKEFEYVDHFIDDGTLYISFTGVDDYRMCITSLDDNGESYFNVEDGLSGYIPINLPQGNDYCICLTKDGYKPYILNLYLSGRIQNDKIANDAVVLSDSVQIGEDVTSQKAFGPVSIESGNVFVKCPQGVLLKNNFEISKGATLKIDPAVESLYDETEE